MKVGGLACLGLDEIDVEEPEEEEEPEEVPIQLPMEQGRKESDGGSYTVDVSSIVGKHKEE